MLVDLDVVDTSDMQQLRSFVEIAFTLVDCSSRGTINFGQTLAWYARYLYTEAGPLQDLPDEDDSQQQPLQPFQQPMQPLNSSNTNSQHQHHGTQQ